MISPSPVPPPSSAGPRGSRSRVAPGARRWRAAPVSRPRTPRRRSVRGWGCTTSVSRETRRRHGSRRGRRRSRCARGASGVHEERGGRSRSMATLSQGGPARAGVCLTVLGRDRWRQLAEPSTQARGGTTEPAREGPAPRSGRRGRRPRRQGTRPVLTGGQHRSGHSRMYGIADARHNRRDVPPSGVRRPGDQTGADRSEGRRPGSSRSRRARPTVLARGLDELDRQAQLVSAQGELAADQARAGGALLGGQRGAVLDRLGQGAGQRRARARRGPRRRCRRGGPRPGRRGRARGTCRSGGPPRPGARPGRRGGGPGRRARGPRPGAAPSGGTRGCPPRSSTPSRRPPRGRSARPPRWPARARR